MLAMAVLFASCTTVCNLAITVRTTLGLGPGGDVRYTIYNFGEGPYTLEDAKARTKQIMKCGKCANDLATGDVTCWPAEAIQKVTLWGLPGGTLEEMKPVVRPICPMGGCIYDDPCDNVW